MKTFEQFNSDIDPYGEEIWDESGFEIHDLSQEDISGKVDNLKRLLINDRFDGVKIHFHSFKSKVEGEESDGSDAEYGPDEVDYEIQDIYLNENSEIIFTGTIMKYEDEFWWECDIYFTLDIDYPVIVPNKIEIIL